MFTIAATLMPIQPGQFSIQTTVFEFTNSPDSRGPDEKHMCEIPVEHIPDFKAYLDSAAREAPFYQGPNSPTAVVKLEIALWRKTSLEKGTPYRSGVIQKPYPRPATPTQTNQVSSASSGGGLGI